MTEIMNAEVASEMLDALKLTGLFSCMVEIGFANSEGQTYRICCAVVNGATSDELDDMSYEAWLCRIKEFIDDANTRSRFNLNKVSSLAVTFKCRPTSASTYQVECTDLCDPYWNKFVLEKTDNASSPVYSGFIDREDSIKIYTIDQIKDMMCQYYHQGRLGQFNK